MKQNFVCSFPKKICSKEKYELQSIVYGPQISCYDHYWSFFLQVTKEQYDSCTGFDRPTSGSMTAGEKNVGSFEVRNCLKRSPNWVRHAKFTWSSFYYCCFCFVGFVFFFFYYCWFCCCRFLLLLFCYCCCRCCVGYFIPISFVYTLFLHLRKAHITLLILLITTVRLGPRG